MFLMLAGTVIPETLEPARYFTDWLMRSEWIWGIRLTLAAVMVIVMAVYAWYARKAAKQPKPRVEKFPR